MYKRKASDKIGMFGGVANFSTLQISIFRALFAVVIMFVSVLFFGSNSTYGVATQSQITITHTSSTLLVSPMPSIGGTFGESNQDSISISTDNYSGYTFSVKADSSTSLSNGQGSSIDSISSAVSQSDFTSGASYVNKWGYKPSQYITSSGGVDTVVSNNQNFLPSPSTTTGDLLDKTNAANSTANSYTFSFGTKVNMSLPAGLYTTDLIFYVVGNPIVYNVTYDDNTTDTVTNMPVPNPQSATIDGGTPVEESYVTLSDASPVRNDKKFAGWCDAATTTDSTTGDDVCSGTLYKAGDDLPVDQTAGPNITLYAVWVDTLFPVVWNQMGACEFHGATNGNITGSACTDYHDVKFIEEDE